MDDRLPIDLSDLPKPRLAPLNEKGSAVGNMLWMSFGYALQVSPLHTLTLYNAVANGGRMMKPYLVSSIRQGGIVYRQFDPQVLDASIAKKEVIDAARRSMEAVAIDGTAKNVFKGMPFTVAGKTGTAQVSDGSIRYGDGVYQASFAGYFPANKPQFTCIVVIRSRPGSSNYYGGTLAAPVFREIATQLHALFVESPQPTGVTARQDSSLSTYTASRGALERVYGALGLKHLDSAQTSDIIRVRTENAQNKWTPAAANGSGMPDLRGMSLRDALLHVERMRLGIRIDVKGKGKVIAQSIVPGAPLTKGIKLILELS